MLNLSDSKLPHVGTTIFTVMSALANEHGAINLSQGFPDFPVSEKLIDLIHFHMKQGMNQYAPMPGVPALRQAISSKIKKLYGTEINVDTEITITPGGTEAIFSAITALVNTGDEVIILEPAYDCYTPAIELCGGVPVYVQLQAPTFAIDWDLVKKNISPKTRMLIINTPHNPCGAVMTDDDMQQLIALTLDTNIIILSDEVYEHIIFDGQMHNSTLKYSELKDRTLAVFSFGKTFHATGWKMGYIVGAEPLMKEFRKVHQFNVFSVNTPMQYALANFLQDENNYNDLPAFYQQKRDYFLNEIKNTRFKYTPAGGSYFQVLDYSAYSQLGDMDFAKQLTIENGIAAVPLSAFYHNKKDDRLLRFCFAKKEETLKAAAEKLMNIGR